MAVEPQDRTEEQIAEDIELLHKLREERRERYAGIAGGTIAALDKVTGYEPAGRKGQ